MRRIALTIALVVAWLGAREAAAYPQFQLSHDQTCTGCHLSPAGGNLLNENGLAVAESMSQLGTAPEFFYNKVPTPSWLVLGGDLRGAAGYIQSPTKVATAFPMQIELYGSARFSAFTLHANFGTRPSQNGNRATFVWSREHYVMWQQHPDTNTGLYVRAGRFMPVFGLRLAEHPVYTRRYGGTQLYSDTYGAAVEYVDPKYEAHLTGFINDPLINTVEPRTGAAAYGEVRLGERAALGAEGMYQQSDADKRFRVGVTGKVYVPAANLLVQGEVQFVNQLVDKSATNPRGIGAPKSIVGYLLGSFSLGDAYLLDVGLGHYDENVQVHALDRDALDVNLHWFTTSHLELLWTNRIEMLTFGKGGPTGAWSLLQVHYRL